MTTRLLFREDAYMRQATATVTALTADGGVVVDASVFYPTGGGQPGDRGQISWPEGSTDIQTTIKGPDDTVVLVPAEGTPRPKVGDRITQTLDWENRYSLMRVHTALHLLSVVIPFGVTGGSISVRRGRLDFNMENPPEDKPAIGRQLNELIASDARTYESWITDAELDAQPELVKTMSVQPPRGAGRIRLIRIGEVAHPVDLQPCGGTHVARLSEIGEVRVGKIEKKGRMNRRVYLHLET